MTRRYACVECGRLCSGRNPRYLTDKQICLACFHCEDLEQARIDRAERWNRAVERLGMLFDKKEKSDGAQ